jgi:hypothetical protein
VNVETSYTDTFAEFETVLKFDPTRCARENTLIRVWIVNFGG